MNFVGRQREQNLLQSVEIVNKSKLTVLYGRRRVGKTSLIETTFSKNRLIKFEGLEGESSQAQKENFIRKCQQLFPGQFHLARTTNHWIDLLVLFSQCLGTTPCIVFFDEFQWLANNRKQLVSAFKYVWDNHFAKENHVHMI
ncbi:MAG TPA: AAA family ATPase, partial [bacterium]|nr:AAA family ATPase [bacterium]